MGSVEVDTVGGISDRRGCRAVYSRLSESPTVACRAAIGNADTHSGADYQPRVELIFPGMHVRHALPSPSPAPGDATLDQCLSFPTPS